MIPDFNSAAIREMIKKETIKMHTPDNKMPELMYHIILTEDYTTID